jgi:hypothetical protein
MKTHTLVLLTTVTLGLPACTGEVDSWDPEGNVDSVSQATSPYPGGSDGLNTFIVKGWASNTGRVPLIHTDYAAELLNNPLTYRSINIDTAICQDWNVDGSAGDIYTGYGPNWSLFASIVGCALSSGQSVQVSCPPYAPIVYGGMGLAPQWRDGTCNTTCQEKVSACIIARSDYIAGNLVPIDIRGMGLVNQSNTLFPRTEGAYWGNIFGTNKVIKGCYAQGSENLTWDMPNDTLGAVQIPLFNRACYGFKLPGAPNDRRCYYNGAEYGLQNFFVNYIGASQARKCEDVCTTNVGSAYSNCGSPVSTNVATVARH